MKPSARMIMAVKIIDRTIAHTADNEKIRLAASFDDCPKEREQSTELPVPMSPAMMEKTKMVGLLRPTAASAFET